MCSKFTPVDANGRSLTPQYINCGNSNCPRNLPPQPPPIAPTSQPKVEKRRGLGNGEGRVLFQPPHSGSEPAKEAK
ncbi:hypothetical protein B0H10DRAFT_2226536 [Mycena sp. CBHHK59/15]|nr:hypothetical protein B0H10DRAFT_2226536 [Mycena sp. CBHHK59/15]